jgi:hypothetical protein
MNAVWLTFRVTVAVLLLVVSIHPSAALLSLMDVLTPMSAIEVVWVVWRKRRYAWVIPFAAIAVLWNPVLPVWIEPHTSVALRVIAAILFLCSPYFWRFDAAVNLSQW